MNAIFKHILRSASKNKIQALMIILTIVIICVMLFVSFSLSDIFFNINMLEYDRVADGADMLLGDSVRESETFSKSRVERLIEKTDVERVEYFFKLNTILRTDSISKPILVEATDLDTYLKTHSLKFVEEYKGNTIHPIPGQDITAEYKPIIISNSFAKSANISIGDTVEIYLSRYDFYVKLAVMYIAADEGIFRSSAGVNVLCDFTSVGNHGQVNAVYITFKDPKLYDKYQTIFEENLAGINIYEGNNITYVRQIVKNNTMLLAVGLLFIVAIMMLIQLSSYLIIARNRVSEALVFKASGATPNQITLILLTEVIIYAVIGGIFGLSLGRLIMEIIDVVLLSSVSGALSYPVWKYMAAFLLSLIVSLIACLVPALSTAKRSIREMSSNTIKALSKEKPALFIVSTILLIAGAVGMSLLSGIGVLIMSIFVIAVVAVWIGYGMTYVTRFISFLVSRIKTSGGFGLSTKSVRKNKALHTIAVLLSIIIAFSFVVVEVLKVVKIAITPYNTRYSADYVVLSGQSMGIAQHLEVANAIDKNVGTISLGLFNYSSLSLSVDPDDYINVNGVSDSRALAASTSGGLSKDAIENWDKTLHPIIFNQDIMLRYDLKINDIVEMVSSYDDFSHLKLSFMIVGVDYTLSEYDRVAYVKFSDLTEIDKTATHLVGYDKKSGVEKEDAFVNLRNTLDRLEIGGQRLEKTYALTYEEWANAGRFDLDGVLVLLTLVQIAIYVISAMGLINIAIVTVYDRRHELTLYALSGMAKADYLMFSLGEGIITGLSGGLVGLLTAFLINRLLPSIGALINKYIYYSFFPLNGLYAFLVGVIVLALLWTTIAFFNRTKLREINERM